MGLIDEIRARARHVAGPVLGILAVAYFVYHTVQGDRGVLAMVKLHEQVQSARLDLAIIEAERDKWERRVQLLHPDSLDPDMLDERARAMLGYAMADDVIILLNADN